MVMNSWAANNCAFRRPKGPERAILLHVRHHTRPQFVQFGVYVRKERGTHHLIMPQTFSKIQFKNLRTHLKTS